MLAHPAIGLLDDTNEGDVLKNLTAEMLSNVLIDVLVGSGDTLEQIENLTNSMMVDNLLNAIDNDQLKFRLQQVLATARNIGNAQEKLVMWFDTGLNRAQELFKRRMQFFSLVVGAALALLLNVDTLYVGEALWNDPVLRQATAQTAIVTAEESAVTGETDQLEQSIEMAQQTMNSLLDLRLPVGWYVESLDPNSADPAQQIKLHDTRNLWNLLPAGNGDWFGLLLQKLVGLALTTIAVMQGAPFWFDLLRRATGR